MPKPKIRTVRESHILAANTALMIGNIGEEEFGPGFSITAVNRNRTRIIFRLDDASKAKISSEDDEAKPGLTRVLVEIGKTMHLFELRRRSS
jgi:hypothetical protein